MQRGIRGAIQVPENTREAILECARELMTEIIRNNSVVKENVSAVLFTVTSDLNAAFPAEVRIKIGWNNIPFLCQREIDVPNSMERVLRVLVFVDTELNQDQIEHVYLGNASQLRPDLNKKN